MACLARDLPQGRAARHRDNPTMRALSIAHVLSACAVLCACAPALNWRDVPVGDTALTALLPCKPEDTERTVPLAGKPQLVMMRSCKADGATYAVGHARLTDPAGAASALAQWRDATRNGLGAQPSAISARPPPDAPALPQMLALQASSDPSQAAAQTLQGVWFARGPDVFAAFVLGARLTPAATEPFFAGLRLR
jgi:hypothetical protein